MTCSWCGVDAGHLVGDVVPPLLIEQKRLGEGGIGLLLPALRCKPIIPRQRLDAWRRIGMGAGRSEVAQKAVCLARRLVDEFRTLAGGGRQMN